MSNHDSKALSMLAAALEKEKAGQQFYKQAAEKCVNPLGQEIFKTLMADEGSHIKRINEIFESLSKGRNWDLGWKEYKVENEDLAKLFRKRIETVGTRVDGDNSDIEALAIGVEMEQGAITFYEDQLKKAIDPVEKEFVDLMIKEERGHYSALKDLKMYLENPESWFEEKERGLLDG